MTEDSTSQFDINATNVAKGIATLLLLLHHLFHTHPEYGLCLQSVASEAKVCVSLFVLLSGYGLTASYRNQAWGQWYWKRFVKLYMNYWFIMLVFIPISWFVFGNSVYKVFPGDADVAWLKFFSQIVGTHMYFGGYGFNPTWWFISAIIVLYLLFPLLYTVCHQLHHWLTRKPLLAQGLFLCLGALLTYLLPCDACFRPYMPAFVVGIWAAYDGWFSRFFCTSSFRSFVIGILCGTIVLPLSCIVPDSLLFLKTPAFLLISIWFCWCSAQISIASHVRLAKPLAFIGRHSLNIFLMHTFIYSIFFHDLFYSLSSPAIMFLLLLASSLIVSVTLLYLQRVSGYSALISRAQNFFPRNRAVEERFGKPF